MDGGMKESFSGVIKRLRCLYKSDLSIMKGKKPVFLEYDLRCKARYSQGKPYGDGVHPHPKLYELIGENRTLYESNLQKMIRYDNYFEKIAMHPEGTKPEQPAWLNGYLPVLDATTLYAFIAEYQPKNYLEVGSGNSTKFARKAMSDFKVPMKIISVDPVPRDYIDGICDEIFRTPLEDVDPGIFDRLNAGDILFLDNSHYVFPNSDVVVVFLDILPRLKPGVLVHFHDIFIPYDYPSDQIDAFYSEQYVLAASILAEGKKFEILQPNAFLSNEPDLHDLTTPLWSKLGLTDISISGCSFWIRMK